MTTAGPADRSSRRGLDIRLVMRSEEPGNPHTLEVPASTDSRPRPWWLLALGLFWTVIGLACLYLAVWG